MAGPAGLSPRFLLLLRRRRIHMTPTAGCEVLSGDLSTYRGWSQLDEGVVIDVGGLGLTVRWEDAEGEVRWCGLRGNDGHGRAGCSSALKWAWSEDGGLIEVGGLVGGARSFDCDLAA